MEFCGRLISVADQERLEFPLSTKMREVKPLDVSTLALPIQTAVVSE